MSEDDRKRVEVCLTPKQFELYSDQYDTVVVIDVLRATTAITTAIDKGVKSILPVSTVEQAKKLQDQGYIAAAERNGEIVAGFDLGNSPYSYMDPDLIGKDVVLTTTNGTKAINVASSKKKVIIGSLINLDAICDHLIKKEENVLIVCSGWKDKFNLEDTICAGAIADQLLLSGKYKSEEDSTIAAKFIYLSAKDNMFSYLKASSHRKRLRRLKLNKDVKYCLQPNTSRCIPILKGDRIVKLEC